jgi:ABC-2 type transport system ATP-binding protein
MRSGSASNRRVEEVLEIVELGKQAKDAFRNYSLGMKQRLGIGAALLADPELVLLDEPTNGLDPAGQYEIRQLIQRLSNLGKTIFISSHFLHDIQQVCNRVAILQKGNLIKQGEVNELLQQGEQIIVRLNTIGDTEQALTLLQQAREQGLPWIEQANMDTTKQNIPIIRVGAPRTRSAEINALLARHNLFAAEIRPQEGSLEDLFLGLTAPSASISTPRPGMAALARDSHDLQIEE